MSLRWNYPFWLFQPSVVGDNTIATLRTVNLSDSITVGSTHADWTESSFEFGYRCSLCTLLFTADQDLSFIGSSTESSCNLIITQIKQRYTYLPDIVA